MLPTSEQDISPPTVMMAATLVRMAHPTNESLHNALSKAESRLFTHAWEVSGGILKVESESGVGTFRLTDGDTCDCPTRKYVCWHRGAHFILSVLAAAMIAPIRSHFEPLGTRQPAAVAVEDPAGMGDFLDRPELAGEEIEDVPFTEPQDTPAELAAIKAYGACKPGTHPWDARNTAYEAARATGAGYTEGNKAADRAVRLQGEDHLTKAPASKPLGKRGALDDKVLEERRRLAEQPLAAPVLWDTSQFAEEDHESEDEKAEKIVPSRKRAESPPDPFEDVL